MTSEWFSLIERVHSFVAAHRSLFTDAGLWLDREYGEDAARLRHDASQSGSVPGERFSAVQLHPPVGQEDVGAWLLSCVLLDIQHNPPNLGPFSLDDIERDALRVLLAVCVASDRNVANYAHDLTKLAASSWAGDEVNPLGRGWVLPDALERGEEPWKSLVPRALEIAERMAVARNRRAPALMMDNNVPSPDAMTRVPSSPAHLSAERARARALICKMISRLEACEPHDPFPPVDDIAREAETLCKQFGATRTPLKAEVHTRPEFKSPEHRPEGQGDWYEAVTVTVEDPFTGGVVQQLVYTRSTQRVGDEIREIPESVPTRAGWLSIVSYLREWIDFIDLPVVEAVRKSVVLDGRPQTAPDSTNPSTDTLLPSTSSLESTGTPQEQPATEHPLILRDEHLTILADLASRSLPVKAQELVSESGMPSYDKLLDLLRELEKLRLTSRPFGRKGGFVIEPTGRAELKCRGLLK